MSDFHEIRHGSFYKNSLRMREFREDRLGDSRTALKGVNELLTALSILNDQIA